MQLLFKEFQTPDGVRSMYVAIPSTPFDPMWKPSSITVLREASDEASVYALMEQAGLQTIVDDGRSVIAFPNPVDNQWHAGDGNADTADMQLLVNLSSNALPSGQYSDGWRIHGDVHYLVGFGTGASLIHAAVALYPSYGMAAAVCTVGGQIPGWALEKAVNAPVPALLIDADDAARSYYIAANQAEQQSETHYACPWNPAQQVLLANGTLDAALGDQMWQFFRRTRRTNTSPLGDVDRRILPEECGFEWHVRDTQLGDNDGLDHDWLESIPACVREHPERKVPLVLCSHGMSDNPLKTADMVKIHEVGLREGFITVYPFSCDRYKWNLSCDPALPSDVDYYLALIAYLKKKYPIDETRIYATGFSNGAGMAMIFSLCHPEIIAAGFPIDSTFPYAAMGAFRNRVFNRSVPYITPILQPGEEPPRPFMLPRESPEKNLLPLKNALARQQEKRYRLPIMYFYGTRESEYPICKGSNQELSYNFWKEFNQIPLKETTDNLEPDAVGVSGDEIRAFSPCAEHPDHVYVEHTFYSTDHHDDYHFLIMRGKAHEVHPAERELGWAFVSRFRRLADGTLVDTRNQ